MEETLTQKVGRLKDELARAEAALKATLNPESIAIAELLHAVLCKYNHTDQCAWFYETDATPEDRWMKPAHAAFLRKANDLTKTLSGVDVATIIIVLDALPKSRI